MTTSKRGQSKQRLKQTPQPKSDEVPPGPSSSTATVSNQSPSQNIVFPTQGTPKGDLDGLRTAPLGRQTTTGPYLPSSNQNGSYLSVPLPPSFCQPPSRSLGNGDQFDPQAARSGNTTTGDFSLYGRNGSNPSNPSPLLYNQFPSQDTLSGSPYNIRATNPAHGAAGTTSFSSYNPNGSGPSSRTPTPSLHSSPQNMVNEFRSEPRATNPGHRTAHHGNPSSYPFNERGPPPIAPMAYQRPTPNPTPTRNLPNGGPCRSSSRYSSVQPVTNTASSSCAPNGTAPNAGKHNFGEVSCEFSPPGRSQPTDPSDPPHFSPSNDPTIPAPHPPTLQTPNRCGSQQPQPQPRPYQATYPPQLPHAASAPAPLPPQLPPPTH